MKDLQRRKRVMQRSMQLGHCVCNPKKPCPCDTLLEQDLCPCAGERPEGPREPVRLTRLVESAGCASKIDAGSLRNILGGLPSMDDPRVIVGMPAGDDAGVFQLDERTALVQTVDVFSPSVDDPYQFGQVAAANSLSDVYAMGGRPLTALSIVGFPIHALPDEVMREILRGGIDKMAEAGVPVVGGHSIKDNEVKAGFAVTGLIDPRQIVTNAAARPGDRLILTKPLGTGILAFAAQIGRAPDGAVEAAARSMTTLNKTAAERMLQHGAHACTDVTGFGLMGHLSAMAAASGVDVEVIWDDLPLLPGVLECAAEGIAPGAGERNREASLPAITADDHVPPAAFDICFDAQTSGGLLIAVPATETEALLSQLHADGITAAVAIGSVLAPGTGRVFLRNQRRRIVPEQDSRGGRRGRISNRESEPARAEDDRRRGVAAEDTLLESCCDHQETEAVSCCEDNPGPQKRAAAEATEAAALQGQFQEFMKAANAPGALDARTKRAIAIALSILAKCEPCAKIHIRKARDMGFSQEEIDEAAWLAVAFGGCPAMMFYNSVKKG